MAEMGQTVGSAVDCGKQSAKEKVIDIWRESVRSNRPFFREV
jgi:hypothetical protein